jgi:hypothetical protein
MNETDNNVSSVNTPESNNSESKIQAGQIAKTTGKVLYMSTFGWVVVMLKWMWAFMWGMLKWMGRVMLWLLIWPVGLWRSIVRSNKKRDKRFIKEMQKLNNK